MMRIEFPHGDRAAFDWQQDSLRVGSAPDCQLVLPAEVAAPHHLTLQHRPEGWVLKVEPEAGRVYVNARPVRERALLRYGDVLGVECCRLLICAPAPPYAPPPLESCAELTVALRAVAGPLSGRVWPLRQQLSFGATGIALPMPVGEAASWWLERRADGLWVDGDAATQRHGLRIDGRRAILPAQVQPGEQVGLALHRFVVEAPSYQADPVDPPPSPPPAPPPREARERLIHRETFWLVVTAAVLAIGIALALQLLSSH